MRMTDAIMGLNSLWPCVFVIAADSACTAVIFKYTVCLHGKFPAIFPRLSASGNCLNIAPNALFFRSFSEPASYIDALWQKFEKFGSAMQNNKQEQEALKRAQTSAKAAVTLT